MFVGSLLEKMDNNSHPLNKDVCNGLAVKEFKRIVPELDRVLHTAFDTLGDWIKYKSYSYMDIRDQFVQFSRGREGKINYEMLPSDTVMVKFHFEIQGVPFDRFLAIPTEARIGGTTMLRGVWYNILPTLTDNLFSIGVDKIFIPVTRRKFSVFRESKYVRIDGQMTMADTYYSELYKQKSSSSKKRPQLLNYIFCTDGMTEGFKYFDKDVTVQYSHDINEEEFPRDKFHYCESPGTTNASKIQKHEKLILLLPREQMDSTAKSLIASFFYMYDTCVTEMSMRLEDMEGTTLWKLALVRFARNQKEADDIVALERIDEHLESISHYLDEMVQRRLRFEGINITQINELFRYLIINFSKMVLSNNVSGVIGKRLSVVPDVIYPAIEMTFTLTLELTKHGGPNVNYANIKRIMERGFRATHLLHQFQKQPTITVLDTATDLLIAKTTSEIHNPLKAAGSKIASQMQNPAYRFDAEMLLAHSIMMVTKSEPSARGRINCFIPLGKNNEVILPPELEPVINHVKNCC